MTQRLLNFTVESTNAETDTQSGQKLSPDSPLKPIRLDQLCNYDIFPLPDAITVIDPYTSIQPWLVDAPIAVADTSKIYE